MMDTPRNAEEIARRAIALHCAVAAAHGVSKTDVTQWLQEEGLQAELTPREVMFLAGASPSKKDVGWMSWCVEAEFALLWSIQKIPKLPVPTSKCNTGLVMAAMPGLFEATESFIRSAVLRTAAEIEEEYERIYDIHSSVRDAMRHGAPIPDGYDKDVVFFRHYGFNWITGYCGQSWDEITPDT